MNGKSQTARRVVRFLKARKSACKHLCRFSDRDTLGFETSDFSLEKSPSNLGVTIEDINSASNNEFSSVASCSTNEIDTGANSTSDHNNTTQSAYSFYVTKKPRRRYNHTLDSTSYRHTINRHMHLLKNVSKSKLRHKNLYKSNITRLRKPKSPNITCKKSSQCAISSLTGDNTVPLNYEYDPNTAIESSIAPKSDSLIKDRCLYRTTHVSTRIPANKRRLYKNSLSKMRKKLLCPKFMSRRNVWNSYPITHHFKKHQKPEYGKFSFFDVKDSYDKLPEFTNPNNWMITSSSNEQDGCTKDIDSDNKYNGCLENNSQIGNIESDSHHILRSFKLPNGILVISSFHNLVVKGKLRVQPLWGKISINGFHMVPGSKEVSVYSPSCMSYLTINSLRSQDPDHFKTDILKEHIRLSNIVDKLLDILNNDTIAFLVYPLKSSFCDFISGVDSYSNLFAKTNWQGLKDQLNSDLSAVGVDGEIFIPRVCRFPILIETEYEIIGNKCSVLMDGENSILINGGKDSGKSTLARYLLNSSLNQRSSICFLDCDVGQSEFSPSGCISLYIVKEPLTGPPFTHQLSPYYSTFYGAASPSVNPYHYIECIKDVYQQYLGLDPKLPLIINTLGFNRGLGLHLLIDILHITKPNLVLQLICIEESKNSPYLLPDFVAGYKGWTIQNKSKEKFNHDLVTLKSMVTEDNSINEIFKLKPRDYRDLMMLASLHPVLESGFYDSILSVRPYRVMWDDVAVCVGHDFVDPRHILNVINGSTLALCWSDIEKSPRVSGSSQWPRVFTESPKNRYFGSGIMRAIDTKERCFYVVTALPLSELLKVNTFIKTADDLFGILTQNPREVKDSAVYYPYLGVVEDTFGSGTVENITQPKRHFVID